MKYEDILDRVKAVVSECGDLPADTVDAETQLIGEGAAIKSRALVEVLLELEEFAEDELDAEFDWTSDAAMSKSRSIFRTVGVLAEHLNGLQG